MSSRPAAIAGTARADEEIDRLSPEAFADAFTGCARALWCIAAGVLGRADEVDDVLQDGAMIALRKLDQFDPETSFLAWMGRIVHYVALNHARGRRRRRVVASDPDTLDSVAATPSGPATPTTTGRGELRPEQETFDDRVLAALDLLEETARSCLLLRTIMDMPYREISLALGVPEGTAMSHVHRARRFMRDRLRAGEPAGARTAKPSPADEDASR